MIAQLKRVAKVFTGTTPPTNVNYYYESEDVLWYTPSNISSDNIGLSEPKKISKSYFTENRVSLFPSNVVLMVGIGATVGKIGYSPTSCYSNQQINAIVFDKKKVLPKFGAYFLLNKSIEINKQTPVVTLQIFNQNKVKQIELDIPSLQVQQRIVEYLDAKTTEIDKRIELLGKKRDAYKRLKIATINHAVIRGLDEHVKLKDTDIDWIGEIPEHWKQFRLKDIGYMYSGLSGKSGEDFRSEDQSIVKPYIPFTNILYNTIVSGENFHYVVMGDEEFQNIVKKDDILFLMSSEDYESIAKSAVVLDDFGEIFLNSFCRGLRITQNTAYAPFVNYQLNSTKYRDALRFEARGFTRINIKIDRIEGHIVTLPPFNEQKQIAAYLDERCAKIDAADTIIDKQIDALKRLKRSLINEVVTGKRMV